MKISKKQWESIGKKAGWKIFPLLETIKIQGEFGLPLKQMDSHELIEAKKYEKAGRIKKIKRKDKEGVYYAYVMAKTKKIKVIKVASSLNRPNRPIKGFNLGQVVATPGALKAIEEAGQFSSEFINRHITGDWGDVGREDWKSNNLAIKEGTRILSSYKTKKETKIWIITEANRSSTTILLPEEY